MGVGRRACQRAAAAAGARPRQPGAPASRYSSHAVRTEAAVSPQLDSRQRAGCALSCYCLKPGVLP